MKLPKAKKLASGEYDIRLRLDGETVHVKDYSLKKCRDKALALKAGKKVEKRAEARRENDQMTLREAMEKYIKERDSVLSPATIRGYRIIQNNRFQTVMDAPINTVKSWQAVVNAEAKAVSAKTVYNAWGFACSALSNIGIEVKCTTPAVPSSTREWLDPDEIPLFLDAVKDQKCEMAALLALHSLRRSELLAVTKSDIKDGKILVRGAVVPDEHNKMVKKDTNKSKKSTRTIPIFIPRLKELIEAAPEGRLVTMHPDTIRIHINRFCARAGLPEVCIHGLRHTFASLCYSEKISEMDTMRLGGWSNPATMRKIYTHLAERDKRASEDKLIAFFAPEKPEKKAEEKTKSA